MAVVWNQRGRSATVGLPKRKPPGPMTAGRSLWFYGGGDAGGGSARGVLLEPVRVRVEPARLLLALGGGPLLPGRQVLERRAVGPAGRFINARRVRAIGARILAAVANSVSV